MYIMIIYYHVPPKLLADSVYVSGLSSRRTSCAIKASPNSCMLITCSNPHPTQKLELEENIVGLKLELVLGSCIS
jgi:hypothetical protein